MAEISGTPNIPPPSPAIKDANPILPKDQLRPEIRNALTTPKRDLKVIYVIPIRGEVDNGNFFLQLKDFTRQRVVGKDEFEVIYVRNNKPEDIITQNQFYRENVTILSAIEYIQGSSDVIPAGLEYWQVQILQSARANKLRAQTIATPTKFLSDTDVDHNIESSRVLGENQAVERLRSVGIDGAIVMMDADTRIHGDSTRQVAEQLVDNPNIGMLKIPYDMIPGEGGREIFETTALNRFINNCTTIRNALRGWQDAGWYAIKAESLGIVDPSMASVYQRDAIQPTQGDVKLASGIIFWTEDRARPRDIGGQFGSRRYNHLDDNYNKHNEEFKLEHPALTLLLDIYENNLGNADLRSKVSQQLETYFSTEQWFPEIKAKILRGESVSYYQILLNARHQNLVSAKQYAELVYSIMRNLSSESNDGFNDIVIAEVERERRRHNMVINSVHRLLSNAYTLPTGRKLRIEDIQATPHKQTLEAHFLQANPWIIEALQQARATYDSQAEAFLALQLQFPEFLLTFEDTNYTYANALILGIARGMDQVRLHPSDFPGMSRIMTFR